MLLNVTVSESGKREATASRERERERVQVGAEGTSIVGQLEKRRETPPQTLFPQAERERNAA